MVPTNTPTRRHRRLTVAGTARLLVTLAGGLLVWSWAAGPAAARQVTPGNGPGHVGRTAHPAAPATVALRTPLAGNAGNAE